METQVPFRQLLNALLDESEPFNPRFLYRLSDLERDELGQLEQTWPQVSTRRRQALLEDLEALGESDYILSFEAVGRMALTDVDPLVRSSAVRLLWEYEIPAIVPAFLEMLRSDPDAGVRAAAAGALGRYVYLGEVDELPNHLLRQIEDLLLQVAHSSDAAAVRRRSLEALGFSSREEVIPLIEEAYYSEDKEWLAAALFAMGRSANERWADLVLKMLDHPFPGVRTEAARAAGELEIRLAVTQLIDLLEDENEDVRTAAIWSLSQVGGEGVRDALEALHADAEDDEEAEYIESALDNLAFTEDIELFDLFDLSEVAEEDDEELIDLFEETDGDDEGVLD